MAVRDEDRPDALADQRGGERVAMRTSSGPGSITATSPCPTMYVPVPRYVYFDGFSATTRRTSGDSSTTSPYVTSIGGTNGIGVAVTGPTIRGGRPTRDAAGGRYADGSSPASAPTGRTHPTG